MANPTPTLRQVLHGLAPDDHVTVNGIKWRAQAFLELLIQNNDPRLSENCVIASNGTFSLFASGMGAADATTPTIKAVTQSHK